MNSSQKKRPYVQPTLTAKGQLEKIVAVVVSGPPAQKPA